MLSDFTAALSPRGRPRPPILHALGTDDPPMRIEIAGRRYDCLEVLKHDSWACSALYGGQEGRVICKFNRQQAFFGLPMRWLGRWLAHRERQVLWRLADVPEIPKDCGDVTVDGVFAAHAAAHEYVEGHPLARGERVADTFFPRLMKVLGIIHARRIAVVDLNKRENILVGEDGQPHLIDFQISFRLPNRWPGNAAPARGLLRILQRADLYHLSKHIRAHRPDQVTAGELEWVSQRPYTIRLWRCISTPFQFLRRRLLVLIGVRRGGGMVYTELDPEDAVRREQTRRTP